MMLFALEIFLKITILASAGALAALLLRRASAAVKHLVWLSVLAASVLLPVCGRLTPAWRPPLPNALALPAQAPGIVVDVTSDASGGLPASGGWVPGIWAAGTALLLLRTLRSFQSAAGLTVQARRFPPGGSAAWLAPGIAVPLVAGLRSPRILLPEEAAGWTAERLHFVISHEAMHIQRHDLWAELLAQIVCAIYWFHPLVWWCASRLRAECEQACDDGVLNQSATPASYAAHLVDIARGIHSQSAPLKGAIAMVHRSQLEKRIRSLFDSRRKRTASRPGLVAAVSVAAAALLIPVAAWRAPAQQPSGGLAGVVKDSSGARVPKTRMTLMFTGSDRREFVLTNQTGEFVFSGVPDGLYSLSAASPGFALTTLEGVEVKTGAPQLLNITLNIGQIQESVTVTGQSAAKPQNVTAPGGPTRIRIGGNVQAAKLKVKEQPRYPQECKNEAVQGTVLLRTVISKEGAPLSLEQINQLVDPRLVAAAREAVTQWRWEPTLLNGEPVEIVTEVQVNFTLAK